MIDIDKVFAIDMSGLAAASTAMEREIAKMFLQLEARVGEAYDLLEAERVAAVTRAAMLERTVERLKVETRKDVTRIEELHAEISAARHERDEAQAARDAAYAELLRLTGDARWNP